MNYVTLTVLENYSRISKFLTLTSPEKRAIEQRFWDLRKRFYRDLWRESASRIGAKIEEIGSDFQCITRNDLHTFVQMDKVMLDSNLTLRLAGNKPLTHQLLETIEGYRAPRYLEFRFSQLDDALKFLSDSTQACVVKPASGTGGGSGVTTGIDSKQKLINATILARKFCSNIVIEEEVKGHSYRLLFLNSDLIHAVRRDPPEVRGDGRSSIKQLMEIETSNRLTGNTPRALSPLLIDMECKNTLNAQNLSPNYVPKKDESIKVKQVVNQNCSRESHSVTDQVHPETITLAQNIIRIMGCELAGIDIITTDIGQPLHATGGIIGEVNTTPGLHHHYLLADKSPHEQGVCETILEYIFKKKHS